MICLKSNNHNTVVFLAISSILESTEIVSDPSIEREESAVFILEGHTDNLKGIKGLSDVVIEDEQLTGLLPGMCSAFDLEKKYWINKLSGGKIIDDAVNHLIRYPNSRRCLINFWKKRYRDSHESAACITQLFFRVKGEFLEMHSHARANNAYRCLYIDLHFLVNIHNYASMSLGKKPGQLIHFMDSLHIYKNDMPSLNKEMNEKKRS